MIEQIKGLGYDFALETKNPRKIKGLYLVPVVGTKT